MPAPKDPKRREEWKEKIRLSRIGKSSWSKGLTKETDERIRISSEKQSKTKKGQPSKQKGYKRSEETKKYISEQTKKAMEDPKIRELISVKGKEGYKNGRINPMKGKKRPDLAEYNIDHAIDRIGKTYEEIYGEEKAKRVKEVLSNSIKNSYENPILRQMRRIAIIRQTFSRVSKLEMKVREELENRNYVFQAQYPLKISVVDIAFPEKKLAIYVDGDYWHNYPDGLEKDKIQTQKLEEMGWNVLRFWEHEINQDLNGCMRRIEEGLN